MGATITIVLLHGGQVRSYGAVRRNCATPCPAPMRRFYFALRFLSASSTSAQVPTVPRTPLRWWRPHPRRWRPARHRNKTSDLRRQA